MHEADGSPAHTRSRVEEGGFSDGNSHRVCSPDDKSRQEEEKKEKEAESSALDTYVAEAEIHFADPTPTESHALSSVGRCRGQDHSKPPKEYNFDYLDIPGLDNWSYPPTSDEAVYDSLMGQSSRRQEGRQPLPGELAKVTAKAMSLYPSTGHDPRVEQLDWQHIKGKLLYLLNYDVVLDSSPGLPLAHHGNTERVIASFGKGFIIDATVARLRLLLEFDCSKLSAQELIEKKLTDLIRTIVKKEPHNKKKTISKRWRLIACVSLVDQLIDRLLHTTQNKMEIALWKRIPSCPGIGLSSDNDGKILVRKVNQHLPESIAMSDISGFDWSVQGWELLWDAEVRCKLQGSPPNISRWIMNRAHCICRSIWATPKGTLLRQNVLGVQLSGLLNTGSTNSRIRAMIAWILGSDYALTMGDDCLEDPIANAMELYAALGHPLKMYDTSSEEFEFCSHLFHRITGHYYPADPTKSLFSLLTKRESTGEWDEQALLAFRHHVRHAPLRERYLNAISDYDTRETL